MSNEQMPIEEDVEVISENSEKKFTPFQWVVIGLLGALVMILVGFLIVYALRGASDDRSAEQEMHDASSGDVAKDTDVQPPSILQESKPSTLEGSDDTDTTQIIKKADLYIKSYDLDDEPVIDEEFTATIVIGNKGTIAAQSFSWEWWSTASDRVCKGDIGSLAAGATVTVECDHSYDDADEYSTKFVVDAKKEIDESNENNNTLSKEIEIMEKADLYISEYSFDHDPVQGEEFTVSITIKNKGETDAEDFYWEWWPTITGSKACREKIDELEAGDKIKVECDHTYGGWANYTTKAVVDVDNDVDESDEDNNTYTKDVVPIH